ncbi:hypothetical protein SAMN05421510_101815 [Nitrosomonas ureae]|uniref:DUF4372 domain-containing protein n=1 Tax=Nitrosomonas ureae TaxID=44577 RepID=A0A1H9CZL6_9PROT|nr:hypothetical protein SAMN05421510_101815 [Nitrosomonas ureae]
MAQLAGRISLRDIVENVSAQGHLLYHLSSAKLTRSNLSRINEDKPYALYEALAGKLLNRCQGMTPDHKFRFKNPLYSLEASIINLCLSVFPWASFRSTKGAIKLHVGLNHDGYLPEFVTITEGKTSDIEMGRTRAFPSDSIIVVDRGCNDYDWHNQLTEKGHILCYTPQSQCAVPSDQPPAGFEEQRPDQRSNHQTDKHPGSKEMSESTSPCRLPGYHYK